MFSVNKSGQTNERTVDVVHMDAIASFSNAETGMTSFVVANSAKGYNVTLRDDDSGEFVPSAICGIATIEAATEKAKAAVK